MKVSSYMRTNPPTVRVGQPFRDVVELFRRMKTDSVLVLDEKEELAGIISHAHAFKALGDCVSQSAPVEEIMEKNVISIGPDVPVDKLIEWNVSSLPVVEGKKVVGLVTLSETINAYNASMIGLQGELEAVIDGVYNGIVSIDAQKKIRIINAAAERYFCVKNEDVKGRPVSELPGGDFLARAVETGEPVVNRRIAGRDQSILVTCSCLRDKEGSISGAVGIFQDSTALENMYRELLHTKEMTEELNAIFESSVDGLLVTDDEGMIKKYNSAFREIVHMEEEKLAGRNIRVLEKALGVEFFRQMKETGESVTTSCVTREGAELLISASPIQGAGGRVGGMVANVRDISNLRLLEEKVQVLNELYKQQVTKEGVRAKYVFESPASRRLVDLTLQIAGVDSTVLITGESGVGKEIIARLIYANSRRCDKPFVKINCGAIPDNLLESELFGYEAGAFTGAQKNGKPGLFEIACDGVLLLDEVGDLPQHLQVKLLRALQEKEIMRIGGVNPKKVDVRIIAATNRDLKKMVETGEFRADLYYRLNVVPVYVPSLRERREDLIPLCNFYLKRVNEKYHMNKSFSKAAVDEMYAYQWPGNIRELENIIERAVVTSSGDVIDSLGLGAVGGDGDGPAAFLSWIGGADGLREGYRELSDQFERQLLCCALREYGSTRKAGEALGVDQSTIVKKAGRLGIRIKDLV